MKRRRSGDPFWKGILCIYMIIYDNYIVISVIYYNRELIRKRKTAPGFSIMHTSISIYVSFIRMCVCVFFSSSSFLTFWIIVLILPSFLCCCPRIRSNWLIWASIHSLEALHIISNRVVRPLALIIHTISIIANMDNKNMIIKKISASFLPFPHRIIIIIFVYVPIDWQDLWRQIPMD